MPFKVEQHFRNLADCLSFVASSYPPGTILIPAKDLETDEKIEAQAPRYLYRGESDAWEETTSSMQRLKTEASLSVSARKELEDVATWVDAEMQVHAQVKPMYSAGYCQHYGLPSELLDLTADPQVAGAFASLGDFHPIGLFAVLDVANRVVSVDTYRPHSASLRISPAEAESLRILPPTIHQHQGRRLCVGPSHKVVQLQSGGHRLGTIRTSSGG